MTDAGEQVHIPMSQTEITRLEDAADVVYRFCDKDKGFYSGIWKDEKSGRSGHSWNSFTGAKEELEQKLHRTLTKYEITILSLAVGFGPTPCLSVTQRKDALEVLWSRRSPEQRAGSYAKRADVVTSFW